MPEPLERLSPGQHHLFQKVASLSPARAEGLLRRANLSEGERALFEAAQQRIKRARIVINLNLHERVFNKSLIESILASKRLYNVFEIAHAGMATNPTRPRLRLLQEFKNYSINLNTPGI